MYGGTKTEMERLLKDAEELSGKSFDISNLADVYDAIHIIQQNLDITGTTSKEAATTLEGSFLSMKAAADNLLGSMSMRPELVQESLSNLVVATKTFLVGNLVPAIGNVLQSIPVVITSFMQGDFIGSFMNGFADLSGKILEFSNTFVSSGIELLVKLAEGIAQGLPTFIQKAPIIVGNLADIINQNAPRLLLAGIKIAITLAKGIISALPTLVATMPKLIKAAVKVWSAFGWAGVGKLAISGIAKGAKSAVSKILEPIKTAIKKIKSLFPVKIGNLLKGLKTPHFSLNMGSKDFGKLGSVRYPTGLKVSWHKDGGIFDAASIIGYGVGERGAEAIIPLDAFWNRMDNMTEAIRTGGGNSGVVEIYLDGSVIAKSTVNYINGQVQRYGSSPLMV